MESSIHSFARQFEFEPAVSHAEKLGNPAHFILAGMGGSHLAGGLLATLDPAVPLTVHKSYGLPTLPETVLERSLVIASSYSGNTEEALDALDAALRRKLPAAVIAAGGALLTRAKAEELPHVALPTGDLQPRMAIGLSTLALARITGRRDAEKELRALSASLRPDALEEAGRCLGEALRGRIPLIYSSTENDAVAYNWKIKFNETAKVPAFYNVVPELNHNEMNGFDAVAASKPLVERFSVILLPDPDDHPRIARRMEALRGILTSRGIPIETAPLSGDTRALRIFSSLILADWTALALAGAYGRDPSAVPLIEEFKKLIASPD